MYIEKYIKYNLVIAGYKKLKLLLLLLLLLILINILELQLNTY